MKIDGYYKFDANNMFRTSSVRGNNRLGKLWNTRKTPENSTGKQVNFVRGDGIMIEYERCILKRLGWGEVFHSVKHDCVNDITA